MARKLRIASEERTSWRSRSPIVRGSYCSVLFTGRNQRVCESASDVSAHAWIATSVSRLRSSKLGSLYWRQSFDSRHGSSCESRSENLRPGGSAPNSRRFRESATEKRSRVGATAVSAISASDPCDTHSFASGGLYSSSGPSSAPPPSPPSPPPSPVAPGAAAASASAAYFSTTASFAFTVRQM